MQRLAGGWTLGMATGRRHLGLALGLALLSGLGRVPGGWLILRGIGQDILDAMPQGYAAALLLMAACATIAALVSRGPLGQTSALELGAVENR